MAGKAAALGGPVRISDYLSVGLLARLVPRLWVDEALQQHQRHSQRIRDLPAHAVAYYVMALSLYRSVNAEEVLRVVTEGLSFLGDAGVKSELAKSSISAARSRLGSEVMETLARRALQPLADARVPGAFYRHWHLVSLDGTTLEVADESANRKAFGVPGTQQGTTGYPQLRIVSLMEIGTQALFGTAIGGYKQSEVSLTYPVIAHLRPGMLCIADRGFAGFPLFQAARNTGSDLLWRIPRNRKLPRLESFADGSYRSTIEPSPKSIKDNKLTDVSPIPVRVVDYTLPGVEGAESLYRLITTILDPAQAPADELASLYHRRWRIETAFAELKTTLKGADIVLRSKTSDLVLQECWALLLVHYLIRKLMFEAARSNNQPPDRLSFKHSLNTVRRQLPLSGGISPSAV